MVRARYGDTGSVFDIAAVEATMEQQPMVRNLKGQRYLVLNRALSSDAGHLNALGSQAAAAEFVRVLASTPSSFCWVSLRGVGIDVADIRRITRLVERHGLRFTHRWFTAEEVASVRSQ